MLVFTVVTVIPAASHAAMAKGSVPAVQTSKASEQGDCHHGDSSKALPAKTQQNSKDSGGKCCDQGACTCSLNACHGGLISMLGNNAVMLYDFRSSKNVFTTADERINSAFFERMKRPPRA